MMNEFESTFLNRNPRPSGEAPFPLSLDFGDELRAYRRALDETAAVAITDPNGIFTHVNPIFCALSGYSREELIGKTPKLFDSGYHSREFYRRLWTTITAGKTWRGEIRNRRKNGETYWAAMTIVPFCDADGNPYQYVSVRNDISELKDAKAEHVRLMETQAKLNRAEEAVLTRDRFLSMAAHELKTPLTSLCLRLEHHLRKAGIADGGLSPDEQKVILEFALERSRRLTTMIDDMLDVTKIAAGKLQFRPERMNLSRAVDEVLSQYRHDFKKEGVEVIFSAPEELWGFWDRARIEQVVINLLTNALKYGGRRPIHVVVEKIGESAFLRVRDEGQGMSDEFQARLFGRFAREKEGDIPGNGLGLWISSKIVRAHDGQISVTSHLGVGSVFTVELPCHPAFLTEYAV